MSNKNILVLIASALAVFWVTTLWLILWLRGVI
jgi:hypothetical protein